jgi:anti-anti-sigma factor
VGRPGGDRGSTPRGDTRGGSPYYCSCVTSPAFSYDLDQERALLVVHGDLDEPATVELRETLVKATEELRSSLAVDLTDVTFMPSPAIGVLATSQDKVRRNGAELTLVAAPGSMAARLLTICAIEHVDALDA